MNNPGRTLIGAAVLAAMYFAAGRLGLLLDPVGGFATLVWPPAGIALAVLVLFGTRLWPGVAAGAFLVNVTVGAPVLVALAIAAGNTLEAVVGAWGLRRLPAFRPSLQGLRDVLGLVLWAAVVSPTIAATLGVGSLTLGGVLPAGRFGVAWSAWWLGDGMGVLIVAPLIMAWAAGGRVRPATERVAEAVALGIVVTAMSVSIFSVRGPAGGSPFWQSYMLAPILIWAALRFQLRGAASSLFIVSAVAIWGTTRGLGPFTGGELYERLRALQVFMAVMALTFLVLGAESAARARAEEDLRRAKEDAESASRAKSQFLAVTSHELRTPLTGIIGYADLMQNGIVGPLNETQQGQVARIKSAAWHLVSIIESILTFSRAEAGREEIHPASVDAAALAREAVAILEPEATAKGLIAELEAPDSSITMHTDPGKVRQILLNLLGNAVKFTERGRVVLQVAAENGSVVFRIRDEGPGIPREQLDRIFQPFTQVDQTATRAKGGTGLGLSVARTLVELLGGDIAVESAVGRGSTFTVRLPAGAAAPTTPGR